MLESKVFFYRLKLYINTFFLMLSILVVLISVTSCIPCENGYKQFINEKGTSRFSFEYPCEWKVTGVEIDRQLNTQRYTSITVSAPYIEINGKNRPSSDIYITTISPDDETPDAKSWLLYDLELDKRSSDFALLDESQIILDGVEGEEIKYFYRTAFVAPPGEPYEGGGDPIIVREIYLDHEGLLWNITFSSHQEVVETHDLYFEQFLRSFRFLD